MHYSLLIVQGAGVEDAIIDLFQRALSHLDTAASTVRILFFDFSSALDAIQKIQK